MLKILLYSKCDQVSGLWQQLGLASELKSDLRDTVNWGTMVLVHFNAGKTQLVVYFKGMMFSRLLGSLIGGPCI